MYIAVDKGHTKTSPGASGYLDELKEDREIGKRLIAELKRRGHTVIDVTPPDSMGYPSEINYRVNAANRAGVDLFVSIHLNAGGGTGTEVLYHAGDSKGLKIAERMSANLAKTIGIRDRGAKARTTEVGVLCNTWMTAVLVEVCFVDSKTDYDSYCGTSFDAMVKAIADGIEGVQGTQTKPTASATAKPAATSPKPASATVQPTTKDDKIEEVRYRVRVGGKWLPEMVGHKDTGGSADTFAGNGKAIEYIAIKMPSGSWYQVKTKLSGWLPKVRGYDIGDLDYGCAGDGSAILAVRCYYETPRPTANGYHAIEYDVAAVGGSFLPKMRDLTDTGGSGDDFAGNGKPVGKFRARIVKL